MSILSTSGTASDDRHHRRGSWRRDVVIALRWTGGREAFIEKRGPPAERRSHETRRKGAPSRGVSGIGRATAERFAREGAAIVVNYRRSREAAAQPSTQSLAAAERRSPSRRPRERRRDRGDVRRGARADSARSTCSSPTRRRPRSGPLLDTKPHHVERTFAITVSGFLRCVQEAVPLMDRPRRRDRGGLGLRHTEGASPATARSAPPRLRWRRWSATSPPSSRRVGSESTR